jgi:hypothetical protein
MLQKEEKKNSASKPIFLEFDINLQATFMGKNVYYIQHSVFGVPMSWYTELLPSTNHMPITQSYCTLSKINLCPIYLVMTFP